MGILYFKLKIPFLGKVVTISYNENNNTLISDKRSYNIYNFFIYFSIKKLQTF